MILKATKNPPLVSGCATAFLAYLSKKLNLVIAVRCNG